MSYLDELYLASADDLMEAASRHGSEETKTLMLIGHNPGMENLVSRLSKRVERFPTAALAAFRLETKDWSSLDETTPAEPLGLWRPRELD